MAMDGVNDLVLRLKSGEYDGADILKAWVAIEGSITFQRQLEVTQRKLDEANHMISCQSLEYEMPIDTQTINKIKSDAVQEFSDSLCHSIRYKWEGLMDIDSIESHIEEYTENKLERGEI